METDIALAASSWVFCEQSRFVFTERRAASHQISVIVLFSLCRAAVAVEQYPCKYPRPETIWNPVLFDLRIHISAPKQQQHPCRL
jgi:hypothetical protein